MNTAQSFADMRAKIHAAPNHMMCSTLPLYILAEDRPRPGTPDWAEIGCFRQNGVEGVMANLSPVDAMIDLQSPNRQGGRSQVRPFDSINPRSLIQANGGWLTVYLVYGYAASDKRLMRNELGGLAPLAQGVNFQIDADSAEHIQLQFGPGVLNWLDRLNDKAGLVDLAQIRQEQAESSAAEAFVEAQTAVRQIKNPQAKHDDIAQCGLYDPIEQSWRFVDFADLDGLTCHG
jgi:hypothetical protein